MTQDLYIHLCDEAQQLLLQADKHIGQVQEALLKAGHPGVRMANRKALEIAKHIVDAREMIDELPAEIGVQS